MIYKVYNTRYVAAVLEGTDNLSEWMNKVPSVVLVNLTIEPMADIKYPFTLIEFKNPDNERIFMPVQREKDVNFSKALIKSNGHKILATYDIKQDFLGDPQNPGMDYMGILPHDHEDEDDD
jgi:hypothetical protein